MRIPLPKARRYRVLLSVLSIALILLAIDLVWVRIDRRITIGYDTTRITSPLKPDGTPDYLRALNDEASTGVTDENNAARMLVPLFDPKTSLNAHVCDTVYAQLHLPAPKDWKPGNSTFSTFEDYLESIHALVNSNDDSDTPPKSGTPEAKSEAIYRGYQETCPMFPWARSEHPEVAAWLERNSGALETLAVAVKQPRFYVPYVAAYDPPRLMSMMLPPLGRFRALMCAAECRAMLRLHDGNFAGALADLNTSRRLSLLVAQGSTLIEYYNAMLADIDVSQSMRAAGAPLSVTQARELLSLASAFPEMPASSRVLDMERFLVLDDLAFAVQGGFKAQRMVDYEDPQEDFYGKTVREVAAPFVPSNFNDAMRHTNNIFDRWVFASLARTYKQRCAEGQQIDQELEAQWNRIRPMLFGDHAIRLTYQVTYPLANVFRIESTARTERSLTRIALALAGYHAEHNEYPATLDALTPGWLPTLPSDPFIDLPFHYTRIPTGYRLYSVGPNGIDDDGHTRDQRDATHLKPDDITVTVPPMPPAR